MNLSLTYNEIQSFIRSNYHLSVTLSASASNNLALTVPVTIMGNTVSFPFLVSVENVLDNKLRLHLNSSMAGMNDLLRGGLTVVHNNILPFVNLDREDVVEVDLESIPQLSSITNMFRITSLDLSQTEANVCVTLK